MGVMNPGLVIKNVIPVVMAGGESRHFNSLSFPLALFPLISIHLASIKRYSAIFFSTHIFSLSLSLLNCDNVTN